jgi:hypothetical protein
MQNVMMLSIILFIIMFSVFLHNVLALCMSDIEHNNEKHHTLLELDLALMTLNAECCYAECHDAVNHVFIVMQSVFHAECTE